jgi:hypothetical protein
MAVTKISDNTLGNMLKIVSKGGVVNNLSEDSMVWQNVKKEHVTGDAKGRQLRYAIRTALGSGAVGFLDVGTGAFLTGRQSSVSEGIAEWKDFGATIEVGRTVIEKALKDFDSYGKPLVEELDLKAIALSRVLSASIYADGTGVIAQALDAGSVSSSKTVWNLDTGDTARGFVGWIEEGDILYPVNADGTAANPTLSSGTFDHYQVDGIDRDNSTVTLQARNSAGSDLDVTATGVTAGDYLIRVAASSAQDLSSIGSTDYNSLSFALTGLDSLTQDDGRVVNNITLSGNAAGTRQDESGNPIDSQAFQKVLSKLMRRAGKGRYQYNQALMAWETYDALIESRETDRRFMSVTDTKKGAPGMGYVHGRNVVMFDPDEFCPKNRIYLIPNKGALQFHGTDFDFVSPNGNDKFHLRPSASAGSYDRVVQSFMEGSGALITVHAAALGCIHNFS